MKTEVDIQSSVAELVASGLSDEEIADRVLSGLGKRGLKQLAKERVEMERRQREEGIRYYEPFDDPNSQLDAHKSRAFIRMGIGGNKGGKTHWQASEHIWWATRTHPYVETPKPPVHLRWATVDIEDGIKKVAIPKFKELVKRGDLRGGSWETAYSKESRTLNYANGSTEEFMCFVPDQQILMGDGTWQKIVNLKVGDSLQSPDGVPIKVTKCFKYIYAPILRIKTYGGNVLISTFNHRHRLKNGRLIRTDKLKIGDKLDRAIPHVPHIEKVDDWKVGWTAIMIGDGCLRGKTPFFTVSKKKSELLKNLPPLPPTCHLIKRGGNARADNYFVATSKNKGNPLKESLVKDELWRKTSVEKRIPGWVFKLSDSQLRYFLRYLWSTDGTIGDRQASYTTISSGLAEDVKHLLWRLKISASVTSAWNQGGFSPNGVQSYMVRVSSHYNKFTREIGKIGVESKERLPSKKYKNEHRFDFGQIREITDCGNSSVYCVEVEGHLMIADGIVTSNSYDQDADKFSGADRHLIGFDEPPPQPIFDECLFRCIKYKGRVTITFTPTEDNPNTGWLYDFYLKAIESNDKDHIEIFSFDPRLNRALDQAWLEKFWSKFTEEQLLSRKLGKFPQFAGLVFKSFSRAKHVIKCFVPPRDWTRYLMIDPHERTPTAVLFLAVNPDGEFFVYDEIFEEGTGKVLVDLTKAKIGEDKIEVTWMDAYGKNKDNFKQSSIWQEFVDPDRDGSDQGIFSITVKFTEELKQRGLRIIRDYLGLDKVYQKPKIFFMDNCPLTIHEFETAIYDDYKLKSTKPLKETIRKRGIHFIDCLMMALVNNPIYVKLRSPQDDQYSSPYAYLNRSGK